METLLKFNCLTNEFAPEKLPKPNRKLSRLPFPPFFRGRTVKLPGVYAYSFHLHYPFIITFLVGLDFVVGGWGHITFGPTSWSNKHQGLTTVRQGHHHGSRHPRRFFQDQIDPIEFAVGGHLQVRALPGCFPENELVLQ